MAFYKSFYFTINKNIIEALVGQISFTDYQPRWSEFSEDESDTDSMSDDDELNEYRKEKNIEHFPFKSWDETPFSLKFLLGELFARNSSNSTSLLLLRL